MNHPFRTIQRLVVSALVLSAVAVAQAGPNNTSNSKSTEHHSKISKMAFWRHHNADKTAKQNPPKTAETKTAETKPAQARPAETKVAQTKPAPAKKSQASSQVNAVSAKQPASKIDPKHTTTKIDPKHTTTKTAASSASKSGAKPSSVQSKKLPQKSTTAENTQHPGRDSSKN